MAVDSLDKKYRPRTLDQVIGQPVIVQAFKNAFKYKTLHHAYILAGHVGSGKTSTARILAASENCNTGPSTKPCGTCGICKPIFEGRSVDIKEIDAASNRGIDRIRQLHSSIYEMGIYCKVRYIIIDEAHGLTESAAEASLKMIEEPPSHVRFILATTDPHKLKSTIHSRCIMWRFKKVNWLDMYKHIQFICGEEKFEYDEAALKLIAKYSRGSVRNSIQNLTNVVNFIGAGTITLDAVKQVLSAVEDDKYFKLVDSIIDDKGHISFTTIHDMFSDGKEADIVLEGMFNHLNNILLIKKCNVDDLSQFSLTDDEVKRYEIQANKFRSPMDMITLMNNLSKVGYGLTINMNPQYLFNQFAYESTLDLRPKKKKTVVTS
jgi:DNA polymerase III subunit gamma/tau